MIHVEKRSQHTELVFPSAYKKKWHCKWIWWCTSLKMKWPHRANINSLNQKLLVQKLEHTQICNSSASIYLNKKNYKPAATLHICSTEQAYNHRIHIKSNTTLIHTVAVKDLVTNCSSQIKYMLVYWTYILSDFTI